MRRAIGEVASSPVSSLILDPSRMVLSGSGHGSRRVGKRSKGRAKKRRGRRHFSSRALRVDVHVEQGNWGRYRMRKMSKFGCERCVDDSHGTENSPACAIRRTRRIRFAALPLSIMRTRRMERLFLLLIVTGHRSRANKCREKGGY